MKISQLVGLVTLFILLYHISLAQISVPGPEETLQNIGVPTSFALCTAQDSFLQCAAKLISFVLRVLIVIAVAFAAGMLIWAGILYISNPDNKDKAKNRIIYAAIGLVVALLAWVAVMIIRNWLTGTGGLM